MKCNMKGKIFFLFFNIKLTVKHLVGDIKVVIYNLMFLSFDVYKHSLRKKSLKKGKY